MRQQASRAHLSEEGVVVAEEVPVSFRESIVVCPAPLIRAEGSLSVAVERRLDGRLMPRLGVARSRGSVRSTAVRVRMATVAVRVSVHAFLPPLGDVRP